MYKVMKRVWDLKRNIDMRVHANIRANMIHGSCVRGIYENIALNILPIK